MGTTVFIWKYLIIPALIFLAGTGFFLAIFLLAITTPIGH
jgi:hypothetical protein